MNINGYMLTGFGKELLRIININYNNEFFLDLMRSLKQMHKGRFCVSCYEIYKIAQDGTVRTSNKDLLI